MSLSCFGFFIQDIINKKCLVTQKCKMSFIYIYKKKSRCKMSNKEHHYNRVRGGIWQWGATTAFGEGGGFAGTASPRSEHISGFFLNPIFEFFFNIFLFWICILKQKIRNYPNEALDVENEESTLVGGATIALLQTLSLMNCALSLFLNELFYL